MFTQKLVAQLDPKLGITLDQAKKTWWVNLRKNGGMRLTSVGYTVFTRDLDLARYEFDIPDPHVFDQRVLLKLDRKLHMPYYIASTKQIPKKLIFFGSQEAVMINLYGDLLRFIDMK